ncbi:DUF6438 domain-containing protein [Pontibacter roseus]|uniref:DUF6438 domain-containing protein n=1 Tax=Pontibacter roseus TaxID=336989 RepID=UPI0003781194|nr:DUF6438 domain-containing protein [Pontibacter roseus]
MPDILKLALLSLLPFLSLTVLAGCRGGQQQEQQNSSPFLNFQKTPCLGICPSYEAAIATDGIIRYVGWEHVPVKDTVYFQLSDDEMQVLRQEVAQLNPSTLSSTYLTEWSDMPSTITTFYQDGKEVKRVKQEEGGPQQLLTFQENLHQRIMRLVEAEAQRRLPVK